MPSRFSFAPVLLLGAVTSLVIAYLFTIFTRPEIPDWKREEDPHRHGFPKWYGDSASHTPYDPPSTGEVREEPVEILLFIDLVHNSSLLPSALYTYDLLNSRSDVFVQAIGPFAPEWTPQQSTAKYLKAAGCKKIIWRIGEGVADFGDACAHSIIIDELASYAGPIPKVNPRANITLVPQPQHMLTEDSSYETLSHDLGPNWKMGLLAHVLPAANPNVFYPNHMPSSYRAVTYFPRSTTPEKEWPALPRGRRYSLHKQRTRQPPGSITQDGYMDPVSAFRAFWGSYDSNLASGLARAGVCVFEGWQDGILDIRMAQAMLSGCLVAAVPPDVEHNALSELMLPLKRSDEAIPASQIETIMGDLSDAELKKMVLRAFIFARQTFVGPTRLAEIFGIIDRWEQGARGYLFPHSYRWTCDTQGERPGWCL